MAELDPQLVDRAVAEATKRTSNLDYFFDKLSSAAWIGPLAERGLFAEPPAQVVDDQGYVRAPGWSASRYLARVAESAPDEVCDIVLGTNTDNERIHEDFVDAAMQMPRSQAREIALAESSWLSGQDHLYFLFPEKVTDLGVRLAAAGDIDVALQLVTSLFRPLAAASARSGLQRPRARFSAWDYDRLLQRVVADVLPVAPAVVMEALLDLLGVALDIVRDGEENDEAFDALSRIWRPRVADDSDRSREVEEALVSAVRDAGVEIRERALLPDTELLRILGARPEEIVRRIATYALAQPPLSDLSVVRDFVIDIPALRHGEPSEEYRLLLAETAPRLATTDIQNLLEVIQEGPDLDEFHDRAIRYGYEPPTEEQVREHVAWWQAARLKLLLPALDTEWMDRYRELVAEVGDAAFVTSGVVATFTGPTSPFTARQLAAMSDAELLDTLRTWTPSDTWAAPSVEGLGRAIGELAREEPARVASLLGEFRSLRPEFLEYVLRGFEEALRESRALCWPEILELITWLVDAPLAPETDDRGQSAALMLGRREAASLLEAGLLTEGARKPPVALRERIWHAIGVIATDPDPTPGHEVQFGGANMDPVTLSLNTTRPRAIRASIAYAIWLNRLSAVSDADPEQPCVLTKTAPEVGELLETHLDPDRDPSSSVRGAIGQQFVNLSALDRTWARARAGALFPSADTSLREAAWGAYVIYSAPYNDLLSDLRAVYERSVELVGAPGHGIRWMNGDPRSRLGEHLVSYYWRGLIELDDPLLSGFWPRAPLQTRIDVLTFVGRAVTEAPDLDATRTERLMALWEFAVGNATSSAATELGAFAWWVPCATLPLRWRLEQLVALVDAGVRPDPGFLVTRALPGMTRAEPLLTMRALRGLLELERGNWTITAWSEDIERVLTTALESDDPHSQASARDTVHWLGALGYREYRELLPSS